MTPEELLHSFNERFNQGGLEAVAGFWHPDIRYEEALGVSRAEIGQVVARGDRAAWTVRFSGRSAEGVPNAHTWGYVGRIADEMLVECRAYYHAPHAFEALETED